MKSFLTFALIFVFSFTFSQESHYQTIKAALKVTATKDGRQFNWENKNLAIRLDYKTGNFIARINSNDFTGPEAGKDNTEPDADVERNYVFKGILPVRQLINQKSITQGHTVEMQLICDELMLNEAVQFQMSVTRPGAGNYRIFTLSGKLYNDEVNIPAFKDYDNEINLFIIFNAINSN